MLQGLFQLVDVVGEVAVEMVFVVEVSDKNLIIGIAGLDES